MIYTKCGESGLKLPRICLGLWHNFGDVDPFENSRAIVRRAFDLGITHFDLANNYGPPPGAAEENFGRILKCDFQRHRDEMVISTKAGWDMWPGPYGNWGSRKHLIASLDQSLKRLGVEYVDIFYHHRPDPETPIEETMSALDQIIRSGKALYAGVSQYRSEETKKASEILKKMGHHLLVHQPRYNMFDRWIEEDLLNTLKKEGIGCVVFSPLAQGLLTDRYLNGIPPNSRASKPWGFLKAENITDDIIKKVRNLNKIAKERNQSLAQMSIAWVLRNPVVTSALIGASRPEQIDDAAGSLSNVHFDDYELKEIDSIIG
ncbi:MAG: aldo/keto reductase [Candidatus Kryptoniota bacterium]